MVSNTPSHTQEPIVFTAEIQAKADAIVKQYPEGRHKSAILPIMHLFQKQYGWVSVETQNLIADYLKLQHIEVYEVATFYTMFHLHPVGKYVLEVCRTGPCMILGAEDICKYLERKLGIKEGEITADGLFTWRTVECLGACGYAPMMQVGDHFHEHLTPQKIDELISDWRSKA
jgi:NADH-quinone oxidoreductase subunit E